MSPVLINFNFPAIAHCERSFKEVVGVEAGGEGGVFLSVFSGVLFCPCADSGVVAGVVFAGLHHVFGQAVDF